MSLNVDRYVHYLYKIPRLMIKVQGKGNGIEPVYLNISEIAKSNYRELTYSIKYFGMELISQTILDERSEMFVVNGSHDCVRLDEMLLIFMRKFVLCVIYGNLETIVTVKTKDRLMSSICNACGHSDVLDSKNKLIQIIIKNSQKAKHRGAALVKEDNVMLKKSLL